MDRRRAERGLLAAQAPQRRQQAGQILSGAALGHLRAGCRRSDGVQAVDLHHAHVRHRLRQRGLLLLGRNGVLEQDAGGMGQALIDGTIAMAGALPPLDVGLSDASVIWLLTAVGKAMRLS